MKITRDLQQSKEPYEAPTVRVVKLLTEETLLSVCKADWGGGSPNQCDIFIQPCLDTHGS